MKFPLLNFPLLNFPLLNFLVPFHIRMIDIALPRFSPSDFANVITDLF